MDRLSITVVVLLATAWLLQIFLSNIQMRRFHKRSQEWRRSGSEMAIGVTGTTYRRKTYAVVVTDDDENVIKAGKLSGYTIAASLKPVDEVIGMSVHDIGQGDPPEGVSEKTWAALDHAASFIRKKLAKDKEEADAHVLDEGGDAMT